MKRGPTVPPAGRRGPVGSRRGPWRPLGLPWEPQGVRILVVHGYGTVERPVKPSRGLSCHIGVLTETRRSPDFGRYGRTAPYEPCSFSHFGNKLCLALSQHQSEGGNQT